MRGRVAADKTIVLVRRKSGVWSQENGTRFIVVDLDVFSKRRLKPLADAFGDRVSCLHEGRWGSRYSAHFEFGGWNLTADQEIRGLIALIDKLPRAARALWNGAASRVFNIGIQADLQPRYKELKLSPRTIELVAQVRGTIVITTYAPENVHPLDKRRHDSPPKVALRKRRPGRRRDGEL